MDEKIKRALETDRLIDITTTGRKTGQPHRIEIWLHYFKGKIYLSGNPGRKKDWFANLSTNPQFTVHFKESLILDVPAAARVVLGAKRRREVLAFIIAKQPEPQELELWVRSARLMEVLLEPQAGLNSRNKLDGSD